MIIQIQEELVAAGLAKCLDQYAWREPHGSVDRLTVILNELFVRCYRWQVFHYGGDIGWGNLSWQWQKHIEQASITLRLDQAPPQIKG